METTVDISRFIPNQPNIINILYEETHVNVTHGSLDDLLKLPVNDLYLINNPNNCFKYDISCNKIENKDVNQSQ